MKKLIALLFAVVFAMIGGSVAAFATGLNPVAVGGALFAASFLPQPQGVLSMALQKEIWMASIVEGLFANDMFLSKAFNADEFVNMGKTVHIPNAGSGSGVSKNRSSFPATVSARTDVDLTFDLDEFTTDPIRIPNAENVELSYSKRDSVLRVDRATLIESVSNDFIYKWSPASTYTIRTTGAAVAAHLPSATGNRKLFTKDDVKAAMLNFNKANVPQIGRYMLADADMYQQLLDSLTDKDAIAFHSQADAANGVMGKLYSFNIMMRSKAGRYNTSVAPKLWTAAGATTDHGAVICWHENSVCRALGEVTMFDKLADPTYYGDIYSFLVRAGGRAMRNDVAGLLAVVQDTAQ
jgi:hypothetical protein